MYSCYVYVEDSLVCLWCLLVLSSWTFKGLGRKLEFYKIIYKNLDIKK
jgi:hypothetical protein